jgi:NAD(P)-dependent dehydrogenase (short-subunit alcohol dehydrogenase family)
MKLAGRKALITGASQGFGLAVARAFAQEGADVTICAREPRTLAVAEAEVAAVAASGARVLAMPANVADPEAMIALVAASEAELGPLDVLVSNAGVYGPKGPIQDVDWNEWSEAIAINLLGTVLACRAVLPSLTRADRAHRGKIILLSGGGATKPLPYLSAYAASKAAVVRFGETLAEEVEQLGVDVNAVAPGALNTRLLDEVLEAGPERVGQAFYDQSVQQQRGGGTPLAQGAALCVYLASAASDGITGRLISAVWDPWPALAEHAAELAASDVYTLRRIVPEDRGLAWQ